MGLRADAAGFRYPPGALLFEAAGSPVDGKVLGIHMHGSDAPEIIQSLAVAVTAGLSKDDFDRTMALHPSTAEEFVLLGKPTRYLG